jgi:hypothetical protein
LRRISPAANSPLLGNIVSGVFTPVLAKHSKNFSTVDSLAIGVDRIQRNFDPLLEQVDRWRSTQITDEQAKLVIYRGFIENQLDVSKHLARAVHQNYFALNSPGFRFSHNVVSIERFHFRFEVSRTHPVLSCNSKARSISSEQQLDHLGPPSPSKGRSYRDDLDGLDCSWREIHAAVQGAFRLRRRLCSNKMRSSEGM